jgi:hypothetical protein
MGDTAARQWVKLELDVPTFDQTKFAPYLDRCLREGITFATMSDLGDTRGNRFALFELNKECSADIPQSGVFYTLDEYFRERIDVPTYNPAAW